MEELTVRHRQTTEASHAMADQKGTRPEQISKRDDARIITEDNGQKIGQKM